MYFIGLDVHKKTISYCVRDALVVYARKGKVGSTLRDLDCWVRTLATTPHDCDGSDHLHGVDL